MDPPYALGRPITRAALRWAEALHEEQVRDLDCAPFILHPLEVGALLSGRDYPDEVIAAGVLHDVVEETDATVADVRARFGGRVADIVAAVTEDPGIEDYSRRKGALRAQVVRAGDEAFAVYAADKVVKAREVRAQAAKFPRALDSPELRERLDHYHRSLDMLEKVAYELPLVRQLAFELWALRHLPPRPSR